MSNIFFVSDTHFGHAATIFKFKLEDGTPMRPFASVEEMDEFMVTEWNKIVKPQDKVYHLGDVAMRRQHIATVGRCNGHKRLVRGNHDIEDDKYYRPWFDAIYGSRVLDGMIFTHIPIHPDSIGMGKTNVHGHVHNNIPALHYGPNYLNISVEVTGYRPLALEEVKQRIRDQRAESQRLIEANLKRLGVTRVWTDEELRSPVPEKTFQL
jgi:calcineurin-like phosphoesterase family protein